MCIRDRHRIPLDQLKIDRSFVQKLLNCRETRDVVRTIINLCLLYTSDAADERSSVDLGGRRIIKKKNIHAHIVATFIHTIHYTSDKQQFELK